jgi:pyruvate-formate lyase-activating enzyme
VKIFKISKETLERDDDFSKMMSVVEICGCKWRCKPCQASACAQYLLFHALRPAYSYHALYTDMLVTMSVLKCHGEEEEDILY